MTIRPLPVVATAALLLVTACGTPGMASPAAPATASTRHSTGTRPAPRVVVPPVPWLTRGESLSTGKSVALDLTHEACEGMWSGVPLHQALAERVSEVVGEHPDVFTEVGLSSHYRQVIVMARRGDIARARRLLLAHVPRPQRGLVLLVAVSHSQSELQARVRKIPFGPGSVTMAGPGFGMDGLVVGLQSAALVRDGDRWQPRDVALNRKLRALGAVCFEPRGEGRAS